MYKRIKKNFSYWHHFYLFNKHPKKFHILYKIKTYHTINKIRILILKSILINNKNNLLTVLHKPLQFSHLHFEIQQFFFFYQLCLYILLVKRLLAVHNQVIHIFLLNFLVLRQISVFEVQHF